MPYSSSHFVLYEVDLYIPHTMDSCAWEIFHFLISYSISFFKVLKFCHASLSLIWLEFCQNILYKLEVIMKSVISLISF